ncbi:MAG: AMP-binding protein, partial [Ruminiclostridium sp.]|nr:AMP-binding protein [Ruminiclostridium sp.]
MENTMDINLKIKEMAERIRELRIIENYTPEEMAVKTGITVDEYIKCENGEADLNFAFIYRCADALRVNVTDLIEGFSPNLKSYTVTRAGAGQQIAKAHGMVYHNLAYAFKNRIAEPLYVISTYSEDAQNKPIELTTHTGQECDIVIEGHLMVQIGEHKEVLGPGDSIYYNSDTPHGMIAVNGQDCKFYAIVLRADADITDGTAPEIVPTEQIIGSIHRDTKDRIYHKFIDVVEDDKGTPTSITFKNEDKFNFAFDLIDELSRREPDKLAMLHIAKDKTERRFTFTDMRKLSNQCANYFASLGIKKGDRVMLILKRHYQFWIAMLGLNKLGAIAIPAVNQLQEHDIKYRFESAGVSAIICTADGEVAHQVEIAAEDYPMLKTKMIVEGTRDGWRNFDEEYKRFSTHFERTDDSPFGNDLLLMFFTSGTSGYPKIAAHNHKYPLGHFHTAKYWHNVDPDGLHFTI